MEIGGSRAPIQFHLHQKQPNHLGLNKGPITALFQKSVCTTCPCSHSASQSSTLDVYLLCALGYTHTHRHTHTDRHRQFRVPIVSGIRQTQTVPCPYSQRYQGEQSVYSSLSLDSYLYIMTSPLTVVDLCVRVFVCDIQL